MKEITDQIVKSVEDEQHEINVLESEAVSLSDITRQLDSLRERASLLSRQKDIGYVSKLEDTMEKILDSLSQALGSDPEMLADAITKLILKGNMQEIKHLMVALSIASDKREQLMAFDPSRYNEKAKKKIQVVFKSSSGEQAGVSIEQ